MKGAYPCLLRPVYVHMDHFKLCEHRLGVACSSREFTSSWCNVGKPEEVTWGGREAGGIVAGWGFMVGVIDPQEGEVAGSVGLVGSWLGHLKG